MIAWLRARPEAAHIILRFVLRLALALAIVVPLGALSEAQGVSPNFAAIAAVVVALALGGRAAAWLAARWGIPPAP